MLVNEDTGEVQNYGSALVHKGEQKELDAVNCVNYTLKVKAKELEGYKGFQILFGYADEKNHLWWTLGGWQNQDISVGGRTHGRGSELSQYQFEVEKGREYQLELRVRGRKTNGHTGRECDCFLKIYVLS